MTDEGTLNEVTTTFVLQFTTNTQRQTKSQKEWECSHSHFHLVNTNQPVLPGSMWELLFHISPTVLVSLSAYLCSEDCVHLLHYLICKEKRSGGPSDLITARWPWNSLVVHVLSLIQAIHGEVLTSVCLFQPSSSAKWKNGTLTSLYHVLNERSHQLPCVAQVTWSEHADRTGSLEEVGRKTLWYLTDVSKQHVLSCSVHPGGSRSGHPKKQNFSDKYRCLCSQEDLLQV